MKSEQGRLAELATKYEKEGYSIERDADLDDGLRADLIARRGTETVLIAIRSATARDATPLKRLAEIAARRGWRFSIVVTNDAGTEDLEVLSRERILALLEEANRIREPYWAFVQVAASALEAAARFALAYTDRTSLPKLGLGASIQALAAKGLVTPQEEETLRILSGERNRATHGLAPQGSEKVQFPVDPLSIGEMLVRDTSTPGNEQRQARALWTPIELEPGNTAGSPDGKMQIAHIVVLNNGPYVARVRALVSFFDDKDRTLFEGREMSGRWSSAPEPTSPFLGGDGKLVLLLNPSLVPQGEIQDFARREAQTLAIAIRIEGSGAWGFTPNSYAYPEFQHPDWRLPSQVLRVRIRIRADGVDYTRQFQLDATADANGFLVKEAEEASARRLDTAGQIAALPTSTRPLKLIINN
ncbi:MAG: hypothetical protein JST54_29190 [Deltaproteobacteria bacterium]|nr:hypothetical protein [Deltaproteobacteria bacterium]